jgi:type IV pilus assembly protein PilO
MAFFDPLVNLPRQSKLVIGIVGLAVVAGAAYFFALSPVMAEVERLETQRKDLESEIAKNQAILVQLQVFQRQAVELERKLALLTEKLPSDREMPPLYRSVSDAAFQSGLAVALFQPREPRIRDYYSEIPITLAAEGGYHDLAHFFDRLAALPRVVTVGDWKVAGLTRLKAPVRAELTLATYTYRPVGSPPAPKADAK